jgi:indolepyruvate ferredoxin oxidoreductase alpha subunit
MEKVIMSGNEAIARGAWEAGCTFAASYPGTPSTEILEEISVKYKEDIYCHWATNEKVAIEMSSGASIGGARALTTMKAQGINVAADPMFVMAYQGVTGGSVIVVADDPSCHSSQNEQDDRWYAPHAKLVMLEPSDSQESKDFIKAAYELSEKYDVPVLLRVCTRISHAKGLVELDPRITHVVKYKSLPDKYSTMTVNVRRMHKAREEILKKVAEYGNNCPFNKVEKNPGTSIGIITSGVSYQYAKEVFGDTASYLKLGLTYPFSSKLINDFAKDYKTIYVIEENDPYLELHVKALGIPCTGKEKVPICDELNPFIIRKAFFPETEGAVYKSDMAVPARPPILCAGCPHKGFYYSLLKHKDQFVGFGDVGCYALGYFPPLHGYEAIIVMGASMSAGIGLQKTLQAQGDKRKVVSIIGDSTFFHSGMTGLVDIIKTNTNLVACVLDNNATAMTGHQPHAGIVSNLMGEISPAIDILKIIQAMGVGDENIRVVDPINQEAMHEVLDIAYVAKGPFFIIARHPCALIKSVVKENAGKYCEVDTEKCQGCKACIKIACPALSFIDGKAVITDRNACTSCGLCMQMCRFDAIKKVGV